MVESATTPLASDPSSSATSSDRVAWSIVADAGGIRAWVLDELRRRELLDEDVDTSKLSKAERKRFKARREEERRVRRILLEQGWAAYRRAHLVHVGLGIFYRDSADADRFDIDDLTGRRELNALPDLPDATALASALGLSIPRLRFLVFHREVDTGTNYHRWHIPKRSGGTRLISAPKPDLKQAQHWIARNISEHLPVHGAAHGFLPGRSTASGARVHAAAHVVVKVDIKGFYPTVTMPRVKGMFRKAGYREQVATLLALLCTESPREEMVLRGRTHYVAIGARSLPQGAPTSPSLSNAVCLRMDARIAGFCEMKGWRYTRYADDLSFSWHSKTDKAPVGQLLGSLRRMIEAEGFALHEDKTRIMRSGRRQQITGLVVNGTNDRPARAPRKFVRTLRAAIKNRELGRPRQGGAGQGETIEQLRGMAAYVYMTDPAKGKAFLDRINALSSDDRASKDRPSEDGASGDGHE